ncbi:major facilitator superfamily protein [Colletotrichum incanum]|uniref:Major facilitator superfamily protein n=1 Tax=Colletotrichum incanum TaxID=1573173 RepID=A0A166XI25_COLIC|nr:major facilitator superfamily protein [Colletotrichum incanum]
MADTTSAFDIPGTVQLVDTQGAPKHRKGQVNIVLVLLFLFLGWGTLLTRNLALNYGRRLTLVLSMVAITFINLWSAYTKSRVDYFINRIIMGIVSSPMETLIEVIIDDLFFVHQRGFYMGVYSWTPMIQYIFSVLGAAASIAIFLFFEENMCHRSGIQAEITGTVDPEQRCSESDNGVLDTRPSEVKKCSPEKANLEGLNMISSEVNTASVPQCAEQSADKTFRSKLMLWGHQNSRKPNRFKHAILPLKLLRFPSILFAGVLVGGILSWYNVVGGSLALILGNAPYNFGSSIIGLFYLASCIHWIGIAFGLGIISVTLPLGTSLEFTYVLDSFTEIAGKGFVSAIMIRNSMRFAFSYAVVPMINSIGLRNSFILTAALGVALWALCFVMIYVGKPLRRNAAQSYWKLVESHGAFGH